MLDDQCVVDLRLAGSQRPTPLPLLAEAAEMTLGRSKRVWRPCVMLCHWQEPLDFHQSYLAHFAMMCLSLGPS